MRKKALTINPIALKGNWGRGWALDYHTVSCRYDKAARFYKTERTELGEAIYRLKYKKRWWHAKKIAETVAGFLIEKNIAGEIDLIATIPPARFRLFFQPVNIIAGRIGKILGIPVDTRLFKRTKKIPPVKFMEDRPLRLKAVRGLFAVRSKGISGRNILIFDDLYRSGMTLREAAGILTADGKSGRIFVLTVTKTRVNR
jgi:predicted amidophosphoribosyltransferase